MAKLTVEIRELSGNGEDRLAGTLTWDGATLLLNPEDSPLLRGIVERIPAGVTSAPFFARTDPARWLQELYKILKSPYLRASRAVTTQ